MGQLIEIEKKKAQEAGEELMSRYHSEKQKGLPKWSKYREKKNPDCYVITKYIVARLDHAKQSNLNNILEIGDVVQDKTGAYYGVVVEMKTESSSEEDV
jgi:hypothetical protein